MKQKKQKKSIPTPAQLLAKAKTLPPGLALSDYVGVMWTLKRDKALSLREIASWLSAELKVPVTHMQVYRTMDASLPSTEMLQSEQEVIANEDNRDALAEEAKQ